MIRMRAADTEFFIRKAIGRREALKWLERRAAR
jgi:hypothetical protein